MSSTLDILKEVILVGTDRKPVPIDSLPDAIKLRIGQNENEASQLLQLITYLSEYDLHKKQLAQYTGNYVSDIIEEDNKAPISDPAIALLNEILQQEHLLKNLLLVDWIDIAACTGKIVPIQNVLALIEQCKNFNQKTRKRLLQIVGNKGRHVATLIHPNKYGDQEIINIEQWSIASLADRKKILQQLNTEQPLRANELLSADWNQIAIREKMAFLNIISSTLSLDNKAWLEAIFDQEYKGQYIKQSTARQCKNLVASMLLRLGNTELNKLIAEGISPYITQAKSKGFIKRLAGIKTKNIQLPQEADAYWNGKNMNILFGIADKNNNIKLFDYDPQFWWSELIKITPWDSLCQIFESKSSDLLRYLLNDESFTSKIAKEEVSILLDAIIENASKSKSNELISSITKLVYDPKVFQLAPLMNQSEYEKFITTNKLYTNIDLLSCRTLSEENKWSLHFSKNMISELLKICKGGKFYPHTNFGNTIAKYFHPSAMQHLISVAQNFKNENWYNTWKNNVVDPVINGLKLRNALANIKNTF